jgi:lipoyl-dependent peroxiredoxin
MSVIQKGFNFCIRIANLNTQIKTMLTRKSTASWYGNLKSGRGEMQVGKDVCNTSYTFATRFENTPGTNPEELVGAAIAGCFSMAFSGNLEKKGYHPDKITTVASVSLDKKESGFEITGIELTSNAIVGNIDENKFSEIAEDTKNNCPVSKLYKGAPIKLNAHLVSKESTLNKDL